MTCLNHPNKKPRIYSCHHQDNCAPSSCLADVIPNLKPKGLFAVRPPTPTDGRPAAFRVRWHAMTTSKKDDCSPFAASPPSPLLRSTPFWRERSANSSPARMTKGLTRKARCRPKSHRHPGSELTQLGVIHRKNVNLTLHCNLLHRLLSTSTRTALWVSVEGWIAMIISCRSHHNLIYAWYTVV